MKRIVLLPGRDPGTAAELIEVLLRAGIEVSVTREPLRSASTHDYMGTGITSARSFPAGAYVVDLAQPQKRLAKALLEPTTDQDAAFVREQLARFARNERRGRGATKEEYGFYDITAWSLPLAFGVEAYWTEDAAPLSGAVPAAFASLPVPLRVKTYRDWLEPLTIMPLNDEAKETVRVTPAAAAVSKDSPASVAHSGVTGRASVAYIIPYERNGAASLAYRLQREGFRIAVATRVLSAGGRDWPRGTMVARVSRNPDTLHDAIARLARETGTDVTAINSAFNETGETGVGSENVISLKAPRIIVAADDAVDQTSYGAMWWVFDRYHVDFTPMTIASIKRAELDRYNVIILPDGSPERYSAAFGKSGIETLRGWCERGGTLVLIKGAAVFGALKDVNLTSSRLVGSDEDDQKDQKPEEGEARLLPSTSAPPQPSTDTGASPKVEAAASSRRRGRRGNAQQQQPTQTATEQRREEADETEKLEGAPPVLPPIASPSARPGRVPEAVPGTIMRATVDRTTYMTFGYEDPQLPVLVASGYFFRPSKEGTNAVVFDPEENDPLRLSGFVWPDNTERLLRGTSYIIEEPAGRGHVILFAEDPNYRGIWRTTTRLFFNSFLFPSAF